MLVHPRITAGRIGLRPRCKMPCCSGSAAGAATVRRRSTTRNTGHRSPSRGIQAEFSVKPAPRHARQTRSMPETGPSQDDACCSQLSDPLLPYSGAGAAPSAADRTDPSTQSQNMTAAASWPRIHRRSKSGNCPTRRPADVCKAMSAPPGATISVHRQNDNAGLMREASRIRRRKIRPPAESRRFVQLSPADQQPFARSHPRLRQTRSRRRTAPTPASRWAR